MNRPKPYHRSLHQFYMCMQRPFGHHTCAFPEGLAWDEGDSCGKDECHDYGY